jgi:hypothetical protein
MWVEEVAYLERVKGFTTRWVGTDISSTYHRLESDMLMQIVTLRGQEEDEAGVELRRTC